MKDGMSGVRRRQDPAKTTTIVQIRCENGNWT